MSVRPVDFDPPKFTPNDDLNVKLGMLATAWNNDKIQPPVRLTIEEREIVVVSAQDAKGWTAQFLNLVAIFPTRPS